MVQNTKEDAYGRKEVKVCNSREEAEMYRQMLDQEGIPSVVLAKDVGRQIPAFNITGVSLMVNGEDYERANEILSMKEE